MSGEIVTRTTRYFIGEDGIVRAISLPGCEETLADAEENVRAVASLAGGRRYPMLFDSRLRKSIEREARARYAGPEAAQWVSALAIVIGSPATRAMGNFYLTLNKPQIPTRMFTSEAEALAWLKGFTS